MGVGSPGLQVPGKRESSQGVGPVAAHETHTRPRWGRVKMPVKGGKGGQAVRPQARGSWDRSSGSARDWW